MSRPPRYTVVIVQRRLTDYRVPLFEALRQGLATDGIELKLLIGKGTRAEQLKKDAGTLDWAMDIPTSYAFSGRICWQPFGQYVGNADLVIVTHENKLIYNLYLLLVSRRFKLAFWGHGRNMQAAGSKRFRERLKRWTIKRVDWWFAYTDLTAQVVANAGFPRERTTVLNNSIDTASLRRLRDEVGSADKYSARQLLGLENRRVGVFMGSLYAEKRLDFLLEAAKKVRSTIPQFVLVIAGDGPERGTVQAWSQQFEWIRWVGIKKAHDKAVLLSLADVLLNPGLVGLGILDAFVFRLPLVTTDCGLHSPEISYLKSGENGIMTKDDIGEYADAVVRLLSDPQFARRVGEAGGRSGDAYSLDEMSHRFRHGILEAINTPRSEETARARCSPR